MDLSNHSPSDLLRCAAEGDRAAQEALLEQYRGKLRGMIAMRIDRRMAARVDPSDIVQEAMQAAHRRLGEYFADPQLPFYPWLRRVAFDRLVDNYRQHIGAERRSVLNEWHGVDLNDESAAELAQGIAASSFDPGRRALQAETEARTKAALMLLKPHDREILVLRYLEQLGVEEIAAVLAISQTAVTSRHLRALQRLKRLLGDDLGASSI